MKKRAMKKWIPGGIYCHGFCTGRAVVDGHHLLYYGNYCRNMKNGFCRYTGVRKQDDILLYDDCKICGIKDEF